MWGQFSTGRPRMLTRDRFAVTNRLVQLLLMISNFFIYFHNIYHFKTVNCGALLLTLKQWMFKVWYSARVAAASVSGTGCIPAARCGWADQIVANGLHDSWCAFWTVAVTLADIFHCFRTVNIEGMFGHLWKVSCLIEITLKYCLKITFYTSQGSAATMYRWDG